jgi:hypothetical protein
MSSTRCGSCELGIVLLRRPIPPPSTKFMSLTNKSSLPSSQCCRGMAQSECGEGGRREGAAEAEAATDEERKRNCAFRGSEEARDLAVDQPQSDPPPSLHAYAHDAEAGSSRGLRRWLFILFNYVKLCIERGWYFCTQEYMLLLFKFCFNFF